MTPDYLTDARLIKIGYMPLKNALKAANVPTADLSTATTKFALVDIAEKHKVDLERCHLPKRPRPPRSAQVC